MLKPSAPTMPGMTDTLDFVKNLWGSMQIPGTGLPGMPGMSGMSGLAAPPMSPEDLDKRIADLRAVESWLNLNLTMLRGSIQAMEVQRGTLMTLKTMGASMAEAMRQSGVSAEKLAANPFAAFFGAQGQSNGAAAKPAPGGTAAKPGTPAPPAPAPAPAPATPGAMAPGATGGGTAQPGAAAPLPSGTPDLQNNPAAMAMPAAVAWWNMLQDQFTQAVASAMAPAAAAAASSAPPAPDSAGAAPKAAASKPAPKVGTGAPNGSGGNEAGNGRRAGRPKADKGTP
ncbi:MAG: hypothetical protein JF619_20800 [Massilia sp.]|nr:hypothetical protein [Massilia sp.]